MNTLRIVPCLLAWLVVPAALQAQAPAIDFKLRSGTTAGALREDLHGTVMLGLGVGLSFPLAGASGVLTVDAGYEYFPGRAKDCLPGRDRAIWYNYNGTLVTGYNGNPFFVAPSQSYGSQDTRNIGFDGFSLRTGYRSQLQGWDGWSWQAGLSLDRMKSKSQLTGFLYPHYMNGTKDTVLGSNEYEGWAFSRERTKLNLGFYAGLTCEIDATYRCEFNVRSVGYGVKSYTPTAYSGKPAVLEDRNGRGLVGEFCFVVKL